MITIDEEIHKRAKEMGLNVSNVAEDALKLKINTRKKSDAPEEAIRLKCSKCKRIVSEGYLCEIRQKFLCNSCQETIVCLTVDHNHIKIPGIDNINMEYAERLAKREDDRQS